MNLFYETQENQQQILSTMVQFHKEELVSQKNQLNQQQQIIQNIMELQKSQLNVNERQFNQLHELTQNVIQNQKDQQAHYQEFSNKCIQALNEQQQSVRNEQKNF
ncbi:unnamed protein product [Rotaria sp. Silwood2]|nr:unnamed protein product [Rotaria sp. Silwood2]